MILLSIKQEREKLTRRILKTTNGNKLKTQQNLHQLNINYVEHLNNDLSKAINDTRDKHTSIQKMETLSKATRKLIKKRREMGSGSSQDRRAFNTIISALIGKYIRNFKTEPIGE